MKSYLAQPSPGDECTSLSIMNAIEYCCRSSFNRRRPNGIVPLVCASWEMRKSTSSIRFCRRVQTKRDFDDEHSTCSPSPPPDPKNPVQSSTEKFVFNDRPCSSTGHFPALNSKIVDLPVRREDRSLPDQNRTRDFA